MDDILFILIVTLFPLIYGASIFITDLVLPVLALVLGIGTISSHGSLWRIFLSFVISFTFFRLIISILVKVAELSPGTLQYIGIFFLILFGLMLIFPKYALWYKIKEGSRKTEIYSALLGFVWAFWVGLSKQVPTDYYEPEWVGPIEIYLALVSSILPGVILMGLSVILSKLYPPNSINTIQRILGCFTLLAALLLAFHVINISQKRDELKPKEPPPVQLHELFNLP